MWTTSPGHIATVQLIFNPFEFWKETFAAWPVSDDQAKK